MKSNEDTELITGSLKVEICDDLDKNHVSANDWNKAHWSGLKRGPWGDEKVDSCWHGNREVG